MAGRFACPDRSAHAEVDPVRQPGVDPAARAVAVLSEGWCPACPERLEPVTRVMYGREWQFGRCPCCRAVWQLDPAGYTIHDRGRLVEVPR